MGHWVRNLPGLEKCSVDKIREEPIYCVYEAMWPPKPDKVRTECLQILVFHFKWHSPHPFTEVGRSDSPDQAVWEAIMEELERLHILLAQGVLPKPAWLWPADEVALGQRMANVAL